MTTEEQILVLERKALDNWSGGNVSGYLANAAEDITYFDDIGGNAGLIGLEAVSSHFVKLETMVPKHNYEMVNTHVQVIGDVAILMYHYHPTSAEGEPGTKWRASLVYVRQNNAWKVVHAHWTMLKGE